MIFPRRTGGAISTQESFKKAAGFGLFGTSHFALGIGVGLEQNHPHKAKFNALGMTLVNTGMFFTAGPQASEIVYAFYSAAALSSVAVAARRGKAHDLLQPEIAAATGCTVAGAQALAGGDVVYGLTNVCYSTGFFTLNALGRYWGIAELSRAACAPPVTEGPGQTKEI